jgi:TetR/AcrR family transcriptional regulator, transcriptional repressor for nem operon
MSDSPPSRTRLLAATIDLVRTNGYNATRVEEVCAAAGVTKGSFFHHFASKDELAVAAARLWNERAAQLFARAPYLLHSDPLERLLGYVKFRRQLIAGDTWEYTCYAGTTIQETHDSHPEIRDACAESILGHVEMLRDLIQPVLEAYPVAKLDATSLAIHMQAVIQGAFVMAKAQQDRKVAIASIDHLHRYIELLFTPLPHKRTAHASRRQP